MKKALRKLTNKTVAFTVLAGFTAFNTVLAQVMPGTPLPTGVTSGSNPIDTGINLIKYAAKYGFVAIAIIGLLVGAYFGIPVIIEWVKGKKTIGEAIGVMIGLLILVIFVIATANYGFNQVDGGGAAGSSG